MRSRLLSPCLAATLSLVYRCYLFLFLSFSLFITLRLRLFNIFMSFSRRLDVHLHVQGLSNILVAERIHTVSLKGVHSRCLKWYFFRFFLSPPSSSFPRSLPFVPFSSTVYAASHEPLPGPFVRA